MLWPPKVVRTRPRRIPHVFSTKTGIFPTLGGGMLLLCVITASSPASLQQRVQKRRPLLQKAPDRSPSPKGSSTPNRKSSENSLSSALRAAAARQSGDVQHVRDRRVSFGDEPPGAPDGAPRTPSRKRTCENTSELSHTLLGLESAYANHVLMT